MPRYPNGRIPFDVLVHLGGEHYLTPGTAGKWAALQADVLANEGVLLQISPGANGYRWYEKQEEAYEDSAPGDAAYPGTSSHGGEYQGRDSMAADVGNWGELGQEKFYSYARKHGFEPGFFDWEPWHIIDWDPWAIPSSTPESEEDDMSKPFFAENFRILWPSGYYSSYEPVIYNALHYYFVGNPGHQQPGTGDTVAREVWMANDYMLRRTAEASARAVVESLKASGIPVQADVDEEAIAKMVVASMPKPPREFDVTVTAKPAV